MQIKIGCTAKILSIFFTGLLFIQKGWSQRFFEQAEIINFKKYDYNGGTQNWNIREDVLGRIFVANNEGLLTFDGNYWKLFPLPNKTIVRSIGFGADNQLYVGGQDELGVFSPDTHGNLAFHSLKNLLDKGDQQFADIWNIISWKGEVFFRSKSRIFRYHDQKMSVYLPWETWDFIGTDHNQLIACDGAKGILSYREGTWQVRIPRQELPADFSMTSICPYENASLITTAKNGLFLLSGNTLTPFKIKGDRFDNQQFFNCSARLKDGTYLIGTYNNGAYHINQEGALLETFSKEEGLQNNNVQTIYVSAQDHIWLGLDNGLAFIPHDKGLKHINPPAFNDGAGYASALYQGNMYFALSNGIFSLPWQANNGPALSQPPIRKIADGLSWQVSVDQKHLLAGREDGFFDIVNNHLQPIDKTIGYWLFQNITDSPLVVAAGNYLGVKFFEEKAGVFSEKITIPDFNTSSRFIAVDSIEKVIWVSHPYRGIYKINLGDYSYKLYNDKDGLPSSLSNQVFKIKKKIVIATEKGVYKYDKHKDKFQVVPLYAGIFNGMSIRYLKEDLKGNIWFVHEKSIGVLDFQHQKPEIIYFPELQGKILSGFENINAVDSNNILIGAEQGFYHINYGKYHQDQNILRVVISCVKINVKTEKTIFNGYYNAVNQIEGQKDSQVLFLDYKSNSIHIEYSAPYNIQNSDIEYNYQLKGFEGEWSGWTKKTEKDYTNLPPGLYTFQVKVRNNFNRESEVCAYSFRIESPWYNNLWAWLVYLLLFIFLLYYFAKLQSKRIRKQQEQEMALQQQKHEEEQRILTYQHQIALEKSDKELINLRNEKLESEIEYKNAELASTAMNLVQKKEFLLKIKEELEKFYKSGRQNIEITEINKILRSLTNEDNLNDEWQQFSIHFNRVHGDFLIKLKNKFPALKPHELKLCAYLRMNLSTKEISHLMSISVRGVEISRYRLRKKLQIPTETNLFQFLLDTETQGSDNA